MVPELAPPMTRLGRSRLATGGRALRARARGAPARTGLLLVGGLVRGLRGRPPGLPLRDPARCAEGTQSLKGRAESAARLPACDPLGPRQRLRSRLARRQG